MRLLLRKSSLGLCRSHSVFCHFIQFSPLYIFFFRCMCVLCCVVLLFAVILSSFVSYAVCIVCCMRCMSLVLFCSFILYCVCCVWFSSSTSPHCCPCLLIDSLIGFFASLPLFPLYKMIPALLFPLHIRTFTLSLSPCMSMPLDFSSSSFPLLHTDLYLWQWICSCIANDLMMALCMLMSWANCYCLCFAWLNNFVDSERVREMWRVIERVLERKEERVIERMEDTK